MGMDGIRTLGDGPWHYCGRCEEKEKIAKMTWQNGSLLCPECVDQFPQTLGIRERMLTQVLDDGKVELQPAAKLTDPSNDIALDLDDPGPVGF
jgi:hypothetical protein